MTSFSIGQKVVCRNPVGHGWIMNGKQSVGPPTGAVLEICYMTTNPANGKQYLFFAGYYNWYSAKDFRPVVDGRVLKDLIKLGVAHETLDTKTLKTY